MAKEEEVLSEPTGILETIKERLNNPFFNKFLLAWCILNWKILYVTFFYGENYKSITKLEYIYKYMLNNNGWTVYWFPLIITIILFFTQGFSEGIEKNVKYLWGKILTSFGEWLDNYTKKYGSKYISINEHNVELNKLKDESTNNINNLNNKISDLEQQAKFSAESEEGYKNEIIEMRDTIKINNDDKYKIKSSIVNLFNNDGNVSMFMKFNKEYFKFKEQFNIDDVIYFFDNNKIENYHKDKFIKLINNLYNYENLDLVERSDNDNNQDKNQITDITLSNEGKGFIEYLKIRKIMEKN